MNKTELIAAAAESAGITKKDTERILNAAIDAITRSLVAGEKVQLSGFGTFEVRERRSASAAIPTTPTPFISPPPGSPPSSPARC